MFGHSRTRAPPPLTAASTRFRTARRALTKQYELPVQRPAGLPLTTPPHPNVAGPIYVVIGFVLIVVRAPASRRARFAFETSSNRAAFTLQGVVAVYFRVLLPLMFDLTTPHGVAHSATGAWLSFNSACESPAALHDMLPCASAHSSLSDVSFARL